MASRFCTTFAPSNMQTMKHNTLQIITAAVLAFGGLVLLFCGVYIDPQGEIDSSLLIGFGEVATFAGALFGIDAAYSQKLWDYINSYDNRQDRPPNTPTTRQEPSGDNSSRTTSTASPKPKRTYNYSPRLSKTPSTSSLPDSTRLPLPSPPSSEH